MKMKSNELINNRGLILKLVVICKDYCYIREIDDFFLYAGADVNWKEDREQTQSSERMHCVEEWIEGIKLNASQSQANDILRKVVGFILKKKSISELDAEFLRSELSDFNGQDYEAKSEVPLMPKDIEQLLERLIKGLPLAMYPLQRNRRKGKPTVEFTDEYDVQDLFHALLLPWVKDIRKEEYTPSYAGTSTRMDFLLYEHKTVCELKYVRDHAHARKVGDELTIDIAHYRKHPNCEKLYAVIYDLQGLIPNPDGFKTDIESNSELLTVEVFIIPQRTLQ